MPGDFQSGQWAVILGGSSGFGLATAQVLAEHGLNLCIVHRDRRSELARIEPGFEKLRGTGVQVQTFNTDALAAAKREAVIEALAATAGEGRVRVLLHSIAFGHLKLLAPLRGASRGSGEALAEALVESEGIEADRAKAIFDEAFESGIDPAHSVASPPAYSNENLLSAEDFSRTIYNMGTSLLGWVRELFDRKLFSEDARVFGLTSEGNSVAWRGYAAVSAAKNSLESLARAIAVEFAPHGIRCNVVQPGVTDTPALAAIPGSDHMAARARLRNPFGKLTVPRDVGQVIYLLSRDEAAWINGTVIRVDGGEHISGAIQ